MALVNGPRQPKSAIAELKDLLSEIEHLADADYPQRKVNRYILDALEELKRKLPLGPI